MSRQARIVKRLLHLQFSGWSKGTIEEQRARQERSSRFNRLPADIRHKQISAHGVAAEWIEAPDSDSGVILYLHGGAYALASLNTHRELVARLVRATNMRALAVKYRLAPEHPFPAALEDSLAAYRWLLDQGIDPSQIIIAGDSAGGGLALATMISLRDAGEPLPAGAVCISPWTDLALTGASVKNKDKLDPILDSETIARYARYYAGAHETTTPLISPLYADLSGLPPLLIQAGTDEILLDDATRCAERARAAGVDVTLEVWDGMFHVFQMVPILPETRKAVEQIARFTTHILKRSE